MTTFAINFSNDNDVPIFLQVDPWAGLYLLKKGDEIQIVAEDDADDRSFWVGENDTTRILTLDSADYYVVLNGRRVHWQAYYLDARLCKQCLGSLKFEHELVRECQCNKGLD